ncbi:MAG: GNAT family N-acetyltransferase [Chloroflexi bacterium]|nr:GNAT family N-acetyltransferase [Chloroflexota bacterium]
MRPLFAGFRPLHGAWEAVLATALGDVVVGAGARPTVVRITLDFRFFAGDPASVAAAALLEGVEPPATVLAAPTRAPRFRERWGERLRERERVVFACPPTWDGERLRRQAAALPPGFTLTRVDATNVARFRALAESLVANYGSDAAFVRDGIGYGVEHERRFVAGCSSFALGGGKCEFEIQTHLDYRRRGLARAVGARLIEHCVDAGVEPAWDAHNPPSAALAEQLGFADPLRYTAWELR